MLLGGSCVTEPPLGEPEVVLGQPFHFRVGIGDVLERRPGIVEAFQLELADGDVVVNGHARLAGITRRFEVEQGGFEVPGREGLLAGRPVVRDIRGGKRREH